MRHLMIILILVPLLVRSQPDGEWRKSYWPANNPVSGSAQTQAQSGEDWFYAHKVNKDAYGVPNGFICAGYATAPNQFINENGGCYNSSAPTHECLQFETSGNKKGTATPYIALLNISGTVIWSKTLPYEGQFWNVIQTSDGGYLAMGDSKATRTTPTGTTPIYYNPTSAAPTRSFSQSNFACTDSDVGKRKMFAVKFDGSGNVVWQYLYGYPAYDVTTPSITYNTVATGRDVVETSNGNYILGGAYHHSGSSDALLIEVDDDGYVQWKNIYSDFTGSSFSGLSSYTTGGTTYYIAAGHASLERAIVYKIDRTVPGTPVWFDDYAYSAVTDVKVSDVAVDLQNNIIVPYVADATFNYSNGYGVLKVLKINSSTGSLISTINYGANIKAYDLQVGVTATQDGGFATVSSLPGTKPDPSWCGSTGDEDYWGTDAIVEKYDANGNREWYKIFDSNTSRQAGSSTLWTVPNNSYDIKLQECMYTIGELSDGELVIAGNHSANFDDGYVAAVCNMEDKYISQQTIGNTRVFKGNDEVIGYWSTISSTADVTVIAGREITLKDFFGEFVVESGAEFFAYINPNLDCNPNPGAFKDGDEIALQEDELINVSPLPTQVSVTVSPNPFYQQTSIAIELAADAVVSVITRDLLGREVSRPADKLLLPSGKHTIQVNGEDLPEGIYLLDIKIGDKNYVQRIVKTQ